MAGMAFSYLCARLWYGRYAAVACKNKKSLGTQALFVFLLTVNETLKTTSLSERQRPPLNKTLI
jgi:hypothetical protein